jgi:16S rRNA (adenine1518-N6/adenine1519-N6)-dimethyltransferase
MRAKKSFGQHFLKHPEIAQRIADALSGEGLEGRVLEVGPGKGILTRCLVERFPHFKAIEADQDMVTWLYHEHPAWRDHILEGDFLQLDLNQLFEERPFALIGNFPYNISSQILFRMLQHRHLIPEMAGMFQKEVARRIIAPPGNKEYGILSVLTQAWYEGKYLFTVSRESFAPPPKVLSGVIYLRRKSDPDPIFEDPFFVQIVKTAFGQRRKMLRNTLRSLVHDPAMLEAPVMSLRPEQLDLNAFKSLTEWLHPSNNS